MQTLEHFWVVRTIDNIASLTCRLCVSKLNSSSARLLSGKTYNEMNADCPSLILLQYTAISSANLLETWICTWMHHYTCTALLVIRSLPLWGR